MESRDNHGLTPLGKAVLNNMTETVEVNPPISTAFIF